MERKVHTGYLKIGMYVSNLDRPWLDTPFLLQGFFIRDDEDVRSLQQYCEYIFIDTDKGIGADSYMDVDEPVPSNLHLDQFLTHNRRSVEYVDLKSSVQEMPIAKTALEGASNKIAKMMENIKAGKSLQLSDVRGVVEPILDSIIRNPDALLWLTRLRQKDSYAYSHSIDNCALAIAFGRHMGLPKDDLRTLAMGMLLLDTGKMKVPDNILNKQGTLTDDEFTEVKRHVEYSVEIIQQIQGIDTDVISIAKTHHERYDGSGYPQGLEANLIPVYGRMAAIIDCYDAMISQRPHCDAISPHAALQKIYSWRNRLFQEELVEQFLQCLGAFPTGSLVEMNTGEVGIVMSQNNTRRLKPKIMMILDSDKTPFGNFKIIDLMTQAADAMGNMINIAKGLEPGAYGIDPGEYYL